MSASAFKLSPAAARLRGFPALGIEISVPTNAGQDGSAVVLEPLASGDEVVRIIEDQAGKRAGELSIRVFRAALVIDRDGLLEERALDAVNLARGDAPGRVTPPVPVALPGASGFRAELACTAGTAALPYIYTFAVAPHDLGVDGGALVTVRCARPEWPAGNAALATLRVLGRSGKPIANAAAAVLALPVAAPSRR